MSFTDVLQLDIRASPIRAVPEILPSLVWGRRDTSEGEQVKTSLRTQRTQRVDSNEAINITGPMRKAAGWSMLSETRLIVSVGV